MKRAGLLLLVPAVALCAVFTTKLQPKAIAAFDNYVERAERNGLKIPGIVGGGDAPTMVDLNPNGDNAGEEVPGGYLHHWVGLIPIPNATVAAVEAVLSDYEHYTSIYSPDVKQISSARLPDTGGARQFDVHMVTEQVERVGLHFAFDIKLHVGFRTSGEESIVESRSYLIRESSSGHAPYTDLLPEGNDHGILWRLNSYWRLRQAGSAVLAECQVISLSRKPLFGTHELIKNRARDSLESTLRHTRNRVRGLNPDAKYSGHKRS